MNFLSELEDFLNLRLRGSGSLKSFDCALKNRDGGLIGVVGFIHQLERVGGLGIEGRFDLIFES